MVLIVALIVLGPTRLPEVGRQVGRAISEVRRWTQGMQNEIRDAIETEPPRAQRPVTEGPPPGPVIAAPAGDPAPPAPTAEGTAGEPSP